MTVNTATASATFTGNGTATAFSISFYFLVNTDLVVRQKVAATGAIKTLTLGSDYTLSGAGVSSGGTLTMTTAPATGDTIYVARNVTLVQQTAYPSNSPFPAASHEMALDRLTMIAQQQQTSQALTLVRDPLNPVYDLQGFTLINEATAVNPADVPNLSQVQSLVVNGAVPLLSGDTGSTLVGFKQGGTGAVSLKVQDKLRPMVSVADFGAVGDGTTDDYADIMAAYNYLVSIGGGSLLFAAKSYAIGTAMVVADSNILLVGLGGNIPHDGGSGAPAATTFVWKGASGATMLTFQTPTGTANSKRQGGGVSRIVLDCQAVAATGLCVRSWNNGIFENVHVANPTSSAFFISSYNKGAIGDASDSQHNTFARCTWRAIDTAAVRGAHGMVLTADTPFTGGANTSANNFLECYGQNYNGDGWRLIDCDNNTFSGCSGIVVSPGTGYTMRIQGGYGNLMHRHSGQVRIEGTASGAGQNSNSNVFIAVDESNGTAYPTMDAGCTVQWNGHKYGWVNLLSQKAVFADSQSGASTELANIGGDTLRIRNVNQSGIALTDGTATYSISQDGSHTLRILRSGAAGALDLTQGAGMSLKMGSVGFNSAAPIAKPTVSGAKGSNAALGSLIAALASYGLITDSTTA